MAKNLLEGFSSLLKLAEADGKSLSTATSTKGQAVVSLAQKYGIKCEDRKYDVGAPGVMRPLDETIKIELQWGSGFVNQDRTDRFNQFHDALQAIDALVENRFSEDLYTNLNVYGRAMFVNIASKQSPEINQNILKTIAPYSASGLDMNEFPYAKQEAVNVGQIFNQYIQPKISDISVETTTSNSDSSNFGVLVEGEIDHAQEKKNLVDALMKNIMIGDTNKIDPVKYQTVETLITEHCIHSTAFDALLEELANETVVMGETGL